MAHALIPAVVDILNLWSLPQTWSVHGVAGQTEPRSETLSHENIHAFSPNPSFVILPPWPKMTILRLFKIFQLNTKFYY